MKIRPVETSADLKAFIRLPYRIYRDDPVWVPPLYSEVESQFNPRRNPTLDHCRWRLYLLEDAGRPVGRIAAFLDTLANDYWKKPVGLFGYYECPPDEACSRLLLDTAAGWLQEAGADCIRGPWSFVSQEWGSVVEGFTPSPVVMSPYNPPFYNDQYRAWGLEKVKDLLVYYVDYAEGYQIPDRILTLTDRVARHNGIRLRTLDMKRLDQEVDTIIALSNDSLANNWGYSPVTEAEVRAMARDLKPIIHPKGVIFAEEQATGDPVGFAIAIPDVNVILKKMNGRLLPFGWLRLLVGLPRLHQYRMFALGVISRYQGRAVDSLLYRALYQSTWHPRLRMEVNYVLEDNGPMNNAILKMDLKPLRRYRIYQKPLAGGGAGG